MAIAGMDPLLLGSVGFLVVMAAVIVYKIIKLSTDEKGARRRAEALMAMAAAERRQRPDREPAVVGGRRIARPGLRRRAPGVDDEFMAAMGGTRDSDPDQEDEETVADVLGADEHVGKKKLAKLQAKAEKKAQREADLAEREERKKREKELEDKKEAEREKERLEEEAEIERKRIEREERERREEEEYQKMKQAFIVDEEGFDQLEEEENANLMRDFVEYVKTAKVVNMDELAAHFKLRTEEAIDRLNYFLGNDTLTGVMDDRGKFIYITTDELHAVAKFINQRGRVSLAELAQYSNKLINLDMAVPAGDEAISS